MGERITLELPTELAQRVRSAAARAQRPFEDVLVDWIDRGASMPDVETLSDEEILKLCDSYMEPNKQKELSDLLERNREGVLNETDRAALHDLLRTYRIGLARKAQALKVAVARGLKSGLN